MENIILRATEINKSFNGIKVLDNVNFALRKGEVHALVGQNGAGKSTLMKILNGVYHKDSGSIVIDGQAQTYSTPQEAKKAGISMVFQDFSLVPSLTVTQNVFLGREILSGTLLVDDKTMSARAHRLMIDIGVEVDIDPGELVESLSVGSRQIVEIAKALATDSKILILDEPTASLSQAEISSLFSVIRTLKAKGISIIYISHYLEDIFKICDGITVLRDGKIAFSGLVSETSLDEVVRAMVGKNLEKRREKSTRQRIERTGTPVLQVRNVSTRAVNNLNLEVWPGEVVGLAGLLGSGRTEIMRALYGVDLPLKGEFFINGRKVLIHSTADAVRQGIALVPEDRRNQGLVFDFSVRDNILISVLKRLVSRLLIDDRAGNRLVEHQVHDLNIKTEGIHQAVRYLSGGNQQKVVIAKGLTHQPRVLLLDDPTFGIDIQSKLEIMNIVRKFVEQGHAALLISSEFGEISYYCNRTFIVRKGAIIETLVNDDIEDLSEEQLTKMVQESGNSKG